MGGHELAGRSPMARCASSRQRGTAYLQEGGGGEAEMSANPVIPSPAKAERGGKRRAGPRPFERPRVCRPPGRTSEWRCSSNTAQTPPMLWRGHMLMILARLVRSESFWAVVKVRSPHTGPGISMISSISSCLPPGCIAEPSRVARGGGPSSMGGVSFCSRSPPSGIAAPRHGRLRRG